MLTPEQKDVVLELLRRAELDMEARPNHLKFSLPDGKEVLNWLRHFLKRVG